MNRNNIYFRYFTYFLSSTGFLTEHPSPNFRFIISVYWNCNFFQLYISIEVNWKLFILYHQQQDSWPTTMRFLLMPLRRQAEVWSWIPSNITIRWSASVHVNLCLFFLLVGCQIIHFSEGSAIWQDILSSSKKMSINRSAEARDTRE